MSWVPHGLGDGVLTTGWPRRPDLYFDSFPAAISVKSTAVVDNAVCSAAAGCPTRAVSTAGGWVTLDRGRCILCGRCLRIAPEAFAVACGAAVATDDRGALVVGGLEEDDENLELVRDALAARVRHLRRSVHIRHVDSGSDGSEEWEVQALLNPVYDVQRLGLHISASPRHADILLITGIGTAGMREPLLRTREAMPDPAVVIAVGGDAISGGLMGGGYTRGRGAGDLLDVDVWVPGSPPSPFSILHGILLALGRVEGQSR